MRSTGQYYNLSRRELQELRITFSVCDLDLLAVIWFFFVIVLLGPRA